MSNQDNSPLAGFGKFVPGFDFLQNLATQAASSATQKVPQMPNLGSWVAPTLNVEELDRRIEELKAVQFWLDQNATALKATIQALEVQKMTLATLKGMNFNMGDVANAFKLKVADSVAGGVQKVADKARTFSGLEIPGASFLGTKTETEAESDADDSQEDAADEPTNLAPPARSKSAKAGKSAKASGVVDPMQWWGALTQQFQTIATDAMKEAAKKAAMDTTKNIATGMAKDAMKNATGMARGMAESAQKTVGKGARAALNTALRSSQGWPTPQAVKSAAKPAAKPAAKAKPLPPTKPAVASKTARKTAAKKTVKAAAKKSR